MNLNSLKLFAAAAFLSLTVFAPASTAAVFTDTLNYGSGTTVTETLFNFNAGPSWTHDINDNLGGYDLGSVTLLDATLTVTFSGTAGNRTFGFIPNPELWSIDELGFLNAVNNSSTDTQSFTFGALSLANLQSGGFFTAVPREWTLDLQDLVDNDRFRLISSTLSGNYIPHSPEPATFVLLGSGLLLGALVRRRNKVSI